MPAMSPTMTEGNIASWKVQEGASFSTGDVLLEIETDKAQMDVEAQDDGKLAKITHPDGSKGVKVGTRIAVIAELDDDLDNLSLPADDTSPASALPIPDKSESGPDTAKSSESQPEVPSLSKRKDKTSSSKTEASQPPSSFSTSSPEPSAKPSKQRYPLYPSIAQLLHEHGIPTSDADKIPASGPKGRLLKGDVLAYLGTISKSYSSDQSSRIAKLGHLDLSNIKVTPPKETTASTPISAPSQSTIFTNAPVPDSQVAVIVSLSSVFEVQKRVQATLGITLPISTFITRATEVANDNLPRSKAARDTADGLFNAVLGLGKLDSKITRGSFTPQVAALPPSSMTSRLTPSKLTKQPDIVDILTGQSSAKPQEGPQKPPPSLVASSTPGPSTNIFSVSVPKGEEKRAKVFLERMKTILQVEPGRLLI